MKSKLRVSEPVSADASVVLAFLLNEEVSSKTEAVIQGGGLCAPALIDAFAMLPIAFDDSMNESPKVLATALELGLISYDTIYLLLAQRLRAPLASFDEKLCVAAKSLGIPVLR